MGTLEKAHRKPARDRRSQRREGGHRTAPATRSISRARRFLTCATAAGRAYFKHIGLYVYRRDFLLGYSDLPVGPLEQAERLEQLRALENGYASAWWRPNTNPWAWIRRKTWSGCPRLFEASPWRARIEMAKYIFVTGGVVSSLGKGHRRGLASAACWRAAA